MIGTENQINWATEIMAKKAIFLSCTFLPKTIPGEPDEDGFYLDDKETPTEILNAFERIKSAILAMNDAKLIIDARDTSVNAMICDSRFTTVFDKKDVDLIKPIKHLIVFDGIKFMSKN